MAEPRDSMLDPKYLGGLIGGKGYAFQQAYVLYRLPEWLQDPAFVGFQPEGWEDVEVFYEDEDGERREAIQVKDHSVTPAEARDIFAEFQRRTRRGARDGIEYCFRLACVGVSPKLRPVETAVNLLQARSGYTEAETAGTRAQLAEKVEELGLCAPKEPDERAKLAELTEYAKFVEGITFETELGGVTREAVLREWVTMRLYRGEYGLSVRDAERAFEAMMVALFRWLQEAQFVTRAEVEDTIREEVGEALSTPETPRGLVLWGKLPFPLANRVPRDQRRQHLDALPATFDPTGTDAEWLPSLPPVPILSLNPGDRVERAFKAAGKPLKVVRARRDVPVQGQHSLLKLAGDLGARSGVVLSQAGIRELRSDAEKRYLLDEAVRAVEGGALLMVGCDPADGDFRAWWAALAPTFRDADLYALGDPSAPWPEGVDCLGSDLEAARAALEGTEVESEPDAKYNIAAVRDLLLAGFTGDDLRQLALYTSRPALKPLLHEFGSGDGLRAMVEKTITHCRNKDCMEELLAEVKKENPRQYANYEGKLLA